MGGLDGAGLYAWLGGCRDDAMLCPPSLPCSVICLSVFWDGDILDTSLPSSLECLAGLLEGAILYAELPSSLGCFTDLLRRGFSVWRDALLSVSCFRFEEIECLRLSEEDASEP